MRAAVIGIGSNSVRMLVAEAADGEIRRISRDRAGTRLFAGLDEAGNLSREAMASSCAAVKRMADSARSQGAEKVHLFATSATRDAANNADFAALLKAETGLTLEICSGDEEAALSFFGATDGGDSGVIDIGGGSTEIIIGPVRLFQRIPIRDHGDLDAVEQIAADILADKLLDYPVLSMPGSWRGTGGTFTTLAAMVKGIYWTDRTYMHGTVLTEADVARFERQLADMTLEQRKQLPGLQPNRADIVVHGICILRAIMRRMHIGQIVVSEYGNLDGYFKREYIMKKK